LPPAPTVPAPWPACRRGVPLGGWVANGRGPGRFPLSPVGEAPKRRPSLREFHPEPKPRAVPAGPGAGPKAAADPVRPQRRKRTSFDTIRHVRSGGDSPFPPQRSAVPLRLRRSILPCPGWFRWMSYPPSRLPSGSASPAAFPFPEGTRTASVRRVAYSVFRFVSSASPPPGYRSDAVTLCESHQVDSACG
jgi:hypothetical protein